MADDNFDASVKITVNDEASESLDEIAKKAKAAQDALDALAKNPAIQKGFQGVVAEVEKAKASIAGYEQLFASLRAHVEQAAGGVGTPTARVVVAQTAIDRTASRQTQKNLSMQGELQDDDAIARQVQIQADKEQQIVGRALEQMANARQTYAETAARLEQNMEEAHARAETHMVAQTEAAARQMTVLAQHMEDVRGQRGPDGAEGRLHNLLDAQSRLTQITRNAEAEQTRVQQEADVVRLQGEMAAAEKMADVIRSNAQATVQMRTVANQESLRATEAFYNAQQALIQEREARGTQAVADMEQARVQIERQIEAERLAVTEGGQQRAAQASINYADAVMRADERLAQATTAANERMVSQTEASYARMNAVAERSEATRLQLGAQSAPQRLQRLVEVENRETEALRGFEAQRNRAVQDAELESLHAVMNAAQQQAKAITDNEHVKQEVRAGANAMALEATQTYYTRLEDITRQREAETTSIIRNAGDARAAMSRQIGAERAVIASSGGSGGGFIGNIGTAMGGMFGGGGGFGGLAGAAMNALGSGLGAATSVAGAAFTGLASVGQGALAALTAPVRLLGDLFGNVAERVGGAAGSMQNFLAIGLGLYGMWEIVNRIKMGLDDVAKAIVETQDVMVRVGSLTAATAGDVKEMTAEVLQVAMETGRPMQELGNAMYFIESHGLAGAAALRALDDAAKLSTAGLGETNQIVRVVAGQMLAYNEVLDGSAKSLNTIDHYYDVFARTVQISAVPADEVAQTFARITPIAAALHIPITEIGADFATISQTGLNANRVMTDLVAVFNQFLQGSDKQREALKGMGLSLAQVRNTLTNKGLIAAAIQIWDAAGHDIDALGKVFGDRARAMAGFLSIVEDGGRRATENINAMASAGGRMDEVYQAALGRISAQWNRFMRIIEAAGIVVVNFSTNALGGVTEDLGNINDALQRADFTQAAASIGKLFSDIKDGALSTMKYLAEQMFGSGVSIVSELARGIQSAIGTVLDAAVTGVADFIAGILLGHSFPLKGPLKYGDEGVARYMQAYATAMTNNASVVKDAATNVAKSVADAMDGIGSTSRAGFTSAGIKQQLADLDAQLLPWKTAAQNITDSYNDMLRPLDQQIASVRAIKDIEYERQQIVFRQRQMEVDAMMLRAEGDPRKRAQLEAQQAQQQIKAERDNLAREALTLQRQMRELKPGQGRTPQEIAAERTVLNDQLAANRTRLSILNLTNSSLLGQAQYQKTLLDYDQRGAKLADAQFNLQKDITLQPLLDQHAALEAKMKAELDIANDHVRVLEQQRGKLQAIEQQITAANAAAAEAKKAAKGEGSPWVVDGYDREGGIFGGMNKQITGLAETMAKNFRDGFQNFMKDAGPPLGQAVIGFIGGGMLFGLPGAFSGAVLLPKIIAALEERGVTQEDFKKWAKTFTGTLHDAVVAAQQPLTAGDVLGSVDAFIQTIDPWLKNFEKALFSEWQTVKITPIEHSEGMNNPNKNQFYNVPAGTVQNVTEALGPGIDQTTQQLVGERHTGLGRTIIETLFGQQNEQLNYKTAYELLDKNIFQPSLRALSDLWTKFTEPSLILHDDMPVEFGPSNAEKLGRAVLGAIKAGFEWVGKNLGPVAETLGSTLADVFSAAVTAMDKDAQVKETMGAAFEALGGQVAGRFAKGLFGNLLKDAGGLWDKTPGAQAGAGARAGVGAMAANPGNTAQQILQAGEDAMMNNPLTAPAMLLFGAFKWVAGQLPETLRAIYEVIDAKLGEVKHLFDTALDDVKGLYQTTMTNIKSTVENGLVAVNNIARAALLLYNLNFKDSLGDAGTGAGLVVSTFSDLFLGDVKSWAAESLWKPVFDKLNEFKSKLTDPALANAIRTLGGLVLPVLPAVPPGTNPRSPIPQAPSGEPAPVPIGRPTSPPPPVTVAPPPSALPPSAIPAPPSHEPAPVPVLPPPDVTTASPVPTPVLPAASAPAPAPADIPQVQIEGYHAFQKAMNDANDQLDAMREANGAIPSNDEARHWMELRDSDARQMAALQAKYPGIESRDSGGPARMHMAYMIGTGAQPEVFVPKHDGQFFPKGSYQLRDEGGPGVAGQQYLVGPGAQPEAFVPDESTRRMYHGTSAAYDRPDPVQFEADGLYGPGYYMTSDPRIAAGYSGSAVEGANIRAIDVPASLNLFNMEAPSSQQVTDVLAGYLAKIDQTSADKGFKDNYAQSFRSFVQSNMTNEVVYDAFGGVVQVASGQNAAKEKLANDALAQMGYDGIEHRGGKLAPSRDVSTGEKIMHDVYVIFPQSLDKLTNALSKTPGGFDPGTRFQPDMTSKATTGNYAPPTTISDMLGGPVPNTTIGDTAGPVFKPGESLVLPPGLEPPRVLGNMLLPSRDAGGPGQVGQPYAVGPGAQPELFVASPLMSEPGASPQVPMDRIAAENAITHEKPIVLTMDTIVAGLEQYGWRTDDAELLANEVIIRYDANMAKGNAGEYSDKQIRLNPEVGFDINYLQQVLQHEAQHYIDEKYAHAGNVQKGDQIIATGRLDVTTSQGLNALAHQSGYPEAAKAAQQTLLEEAQWQMLKGTGFGYGREGDSGVDPAHVLTRLAEQINYGYDMLPPEFRREFYPQIVDTPKINVEDALAEALQAQADGVMSVYGAESVTKWLDAQEVIWQAARRAQRPTGDSPDTTDLLPNRDDGGYGTAGHAYHVGPDAQPEMFVMSLGASGTPVLPTSQGAQGEAGDTNITINGPLIHVEHMEAANDHDVELMLDRVRKYLLEDISTARGHGVRRQDGHTAKGYRG